MQSDCVLTSLEPFKSCQSSSSAMRKKSKERHTSVHHKRTWLAHMYMPSRTKHHPECLGESTRGWKFFPPGLLDEGKNDDQAIVTARADCECQPEKASPDTGEAGLR